jgi:hypothetical protein
MVEVMTVMINSYELTKFSNGNTTNQRLYTNFFIKYRHIISHIKALDKDGQSKHTKCLGKKLD